MSVECFRCCIGCDHYQKCEKDISQGGCELCQHFSYGECTHPKNSLNFRLPSLPRYSKNLRDMISTVKSRITD